MTLRDDFEQINTFFKREIDSTDGLELTMAFILQRVDCKLNIIAAYLDDKEKKDE